MSAPDVWRARYRAATVQFPTWSDARPDRLYFVSDEAGSTQGWLLDQARGRVALTAQAVGVESLVVLPDGSGVAWWCDDTGARTARGW